MNAKALIGMTVFAIEGGKNLGTVERLLFSPDNMRVVAFVVTPRSGMMSDPEPQKVLSTEKVRAIGQDAITVDSESLLDVTADGELPAGAVAFDEIEREKVITESGDQVGEVSSLEFDEVDFRLDFLEIGRGFLSGHVLVTVENIVSVGEDVIVVRDTALNGDDRDDEVEDDRVRIVDERDAVETDDVADDVIDDADVAKSKRDTGIF
jgi:uncharacterized protein YrrD